MPSGNNADGIGVLTSLTTGSVELRLLALKRSIRNTDWQLQHRHGSSRPRYSNTEGNGNTANGSWRSLATPTGINNTAIGHVALYSTPPATSTRPSVRARSRTVSPLPISRGTRPSVVKRLQLNTTGNFNVAVGDSALKLNTTGACNTAIGLDALVFNSIGNNNTATGANALFNNTTGNYNTANGVAAVFTNTTGNQNTAVGFNALFLNDTGSFNTAIGTNALQNSTGIDNTALGAGAGQNQTTAVTISISATWLSLARPM